MLHICEDNCGIKIANLLTDDDHQLAALVDLRVMDRKALYKGAGNNGKILNIMNKDGCIFN